MVCHLHHGLARDWWKVLKAKHTLKGMWQGASCCISKMSQDLPIISFARDIVETVKLNAITIIIGETGSGKTTQIPQVSYFQEDMLFSSEASVASPLSYRHLLSSVFTASRGEATIILIAVVFDVQILNKAGYTAEGKIAVTQPRRVVCSSTSIKWLQQGLKINALSSSVSQPQLPKKQCLQNTESK